MAARRATDCCGWRRIVALAVLMQAAPVANEAADAGRVLVAPRGRPDRRAEQPGPAEAEPPPGCFLHGYRSTPEMKNVINPVSSIFSPAECQQICKTTPGCAFFGYNVVSQNCWIADLTVESMVQDAKFILGPADCSGKANVCAALPGPDFPGDTAAASESAWPTRFVPANLQCWDRDENSSLSPCIEELRVLDDFDGGWPGQCEGLEKTGAVDHDQCRQSCERRATCSVWQLTQTDGEDHLVCWQGNGIKCFDPIDGEAIVTASQRIMRGRHRVLKNLTGYEVAGLRNAFQAGHNIYGFGIGDQDGIRECNHTCLGMLTCEMWEYSVESGCWVHDTSFENITYPPTTKTMSKATLGAKSFVAGEYIQRSCRPFLQEATSTVTTTTSLAMSTEAEASKKEPQKKEVQGDFPSERDVLPRGSAAAVDANASWGPSMGSAMIAPSTAPVTGPRSPSEEKLSASAAQQHPEMNIWLMVTYGLLAALVLLCLVSIVLGRRKVSATKTDSFEGHSSQKVDHARGVQGLIPIAPPDSRRPLPAAGGGAPDAAMPLVGGPKSGSHLAMHGSPNLANFNHLAMHGSPNLANFNLDLIQVVPEGLLVTPLEDIPVIDKPTSLQVLGVAGPRGGTTPSPQFSRHQMLAQQIYRAVPDTH